MIGDRKQSSHLILVSLMKVFHRQLLAESADNILSMSGVVSHESVHMGICKDTCVKFGA